MNPWKFFLALSLAATLSVTAAVAAEPTLESPNECASPGGQGSPCANNGDCISNAYASLCIEQEPGNPTSRSCQIPCESGVGVSLAPDRAECALGETCVRGKAMPGRRGYFCQATAFRVDLNLLDQCIVHFVTGIQPAFTENSCSLDANLTRLLDQTGDQVYDIFDLDQCILSFLEQPRCEPDAAFCERPDLVPCSDDSTCGDGLYCDPDRNTCQRDCGLIASREVALGSLERQCSGNLKVCDDERGRCESIDVDGLTCAVDADCPSGAYCFLGECSRECHRSIDCPSSEWYCARNNQCRALPPAASEEGFVFGPKNYAIRFGRDQLSVDAVEDTDSSALVILDLLTRRQVIENASIAFGYRLELSYDLKQDLQCIEAVNTDCAEETNFDKFPWAANQAECEATQKDCIIDDTEEWIRLGSPFGTVTATGVPRLGVALESSVADSLSPGVYSATLRAIFDNGETDSVPIIFTKKDPSGEYVGTVTMYQGSDRNQLTGTRPLAVAMRIELTDETARWNDLMAAHNLDVDEQGDGHTASPLVDITSGKVVRARIDANETLAFARGDAETSADNDILMVGLYSTDLNRLRLVGVVDIPSDLCIGEDGPCEVFDPDRVTESDPLMVMNLFGRDVRRQLEFFGSFDDATGRYHGIYRESIGGLDPTGPFTLEGNFVLDQIVSDSSTIAANDPVVLAPNTPAVAFPSPDAVLARVDAEILAHCDPDELVEIALNGATDSFVNQLALFEEQTAFSAYLEQARRRGAATLSSPIGRRTVFPDLTDFADHIDFALAGLSPDTPHGQQRNLNVYDFLAERLVPCNPEDPAPPPACVDEPSVRCGLALHQKAVLEKWVSMDAVRNGSDAGDYDQFCRDTVPTVGCPDAAAAAPDLFALQEHNRFWSNASEILKFEGDRARSDAFLVLFRAAINPFAQGAALSFKNDNLRRSVVRYDQAIKLMAGAPAASVMFQWPARAFKQAGNDWLKIMKSIAEDRMGAVAELVDLKRRVFLNSGSSDFVFAQHMMQQEFLIQVYLMRLQAKWQGAEFAYDGEAGESLQRGQAIVSQLNAAKNRLGVTPDRVFFENGNPDLSNWQNYREILIGSDGNAGLVGNADKSIFEAVDQLQSALTDLDTLERSLFDQRAAMEDTLDELCGDPDPADPDGETDDYCQYLLKQHHDTEAWNGLFECMAGDEECPAGTFVCEDVESAISGENTCEATIALFEENTMGVNGDEPAGKGEIYGAPTCSLNRDAPWLDVNGVPRPCVGGEMAELLQEKALVDLQRRLLLNDLLALVDRIQTFQFVKYTEPERLQQEAEEAAAKPQKILDTIELIFSIRDIALRLQERFGEGIKCLVIGGVASGTNCPQSAIRSIALGVVDTLKEQALIQWELQLEKWQGEIDDAFAGADDAVGELELAHELHAVADGVRSISNEYAVLTQTAFNLGTQIEDLRYQAQGAVDSYNDTIAFVADHLVGRESGSVLRGEHLVRRAESSFREILLFAYKMTVAFNHHYNLSAGTANTLINRALSLVTLDEVRDYIAELSDLERDYCGQETLDCDAFSNVGVLRLSLRGLLFPNLRDIVDGRTGQVVTAGEQFHNTVTAPPFLRRRIRGPRVVDQIEVPFSVLLNVLENTPDGLPRWLIDPLTCNHQLDARDPRRPGESATGNVAINLVGTNLGGGERSVQYELIRGPTDMMRSCSVESINQEVGTAPVQDYRIITRLIGHAPQSVEANADAPPSYVTRSVPFPMCMNAPESSGILEGECYRFFGRDRSLASPDWKVVIPLFVDGAGGENTWVTGEGLPAEGRPVIEDLVVYFRYRTRPVNE